MTGSAEPLVRRVVAKIAASPIRDRPFPHIVVKQLLPPKIYAAVVSAFPARSDMVQVDYPGTGFGRRSRHYCDFGYAYAGLPTAGGVLGLVHDVFSSDAFGRALLEKFSRPLPDGSIPIPAEKGKHFAGEARDYSTVFDLQVDLPGYAIAPHRDLPAKIVTFQLFLTQDAELADYGTLLCEPKPSRKAAVLHRNLPARLAGRFIRRLPRGSATFRRAENGWLGAAFRRLERSRLGLRLGVGATVNWFPWEWFDIVEVARALPNQMLAFAPNNRSFHAVDFDVPAAAENRERRVLRGFIMSGRGARNFIEPHPAARGTAGEPEASEAPERSSALRPGPPARPPGNRAG